MTQEALDDEVEAEQPGAAPRDDIDDYFGALAAAAPRLLWHYTDASGLLGILQTSNIWATSHKFLNDSREILYAMNMFQDKFTALLSEAEKRGLASAVGSVMASHIGRNAYIACFSENGDQLSQWRGYGGENAYAIGFDSDHLLRQLKAQRVMAGMVRYGGDAASRAADLWAKNAYRNWTDRFPGGYGMSVKARYLEYESLEDRLVEEMAKELFEFNQEYVGHLIFAASLHKDEAFKEEAEWRAVVGGRVGSPGQEIKFRAGRYGVTPYRNVPFQVDPETSSISEIILGPGFDFQPRADALHSLLRSLGYPREIKIRNSTAPYRA